MWIRLVMLAALSAISSPCLAAMCTAPPIIQDYEGRPPAPREAGATYWLSWMGERMEKVEGTKWVVTTFKVMGVVRGEVRDTIEIWKNARPQTSEDFPHYNPGEVTLSGEWSGGSFHPYSCPPYFYQR